MAIKRLEETKLSDTNRAYANDLIGWFKDHYVADAHMPFHCDSRRFSEGINLHGYLIVSCPTSTIIQM